MNQKTPEKAVTWPHHDFLLLLFDSDPNCPAKSASALCLRLNALSGLIEILLLDDQAREHAIDLVALACNTLGCAVNPAAWLMAKVVSGRVQTKCGK